jgi:hypothetical protein
MRSLVVVVVGLLCGAASIAAGQNSERANGFDEKGVCQAERGRVRKPTDAASRLADELSSTEALASSTRTMTTHFQAVLRDPKSSEDDRAQARLAIKRLEQDLSSYTSDLARLKEEHHRAVAAKEEATKLADECVYKARTDYDRQADAERDAQERQLAADEAHNRDIMSSPKNVRGGLSGLICIADMVRSQALKEIKTEKRYARVAGVQDNSKLYELQTTVRSADEAKTKYRSQLKALKLRPLGCKSAVAKTVAACVLTSDEENNVDPECLEGKHSGAVEAALIVLWMERMGLDE